MSTCTQVDVRDMQISPLPAANGLMVTPVAQLKAVACEAPPQPRKPPRIVSRLASQPAQPIAQQPLPKPKPPPPPPPPPKPTPSTGSLYTHFGAQPLKPTPSTGSLYTHFGPPTACSKPFMTALDVVRRSAPNTVTTVTLAPGITMSSARRQPVEQPAPQQVGDQLGDLRTEEGFKQRPSEQPGDVLGDLRTDEVFNPQVLVARQKLSQTIAVKTNVQHLTVKKASVCTAGEHYGECKLDLTAFKFFNRSSLRSNGDLFDEESFDMWFSELKRQEKNYHPDPDYFRYLMVNGDKGVIAPLHRSLLVEWLMLAGSENGFERDTIQLAINFVDRVSAIHFGSSMMAQEKLMHLQSLPPMPKGPSITTNNYQLLAIACLWLAHKLEEDGNLKVDDVVIWADNTFTKRECLDMEVYVCNALQHRCEAITPNAALVFIIQKMVDLLNQQRISDKHEQKHIFVPSSPPHSPKGSPPECHVRRRLIPTLLACDAGAVNDHYVMVLTHLDHYLRACCLIDMMLCDPESLNHYPSAIAAAALVIVHGNAVLPLLEEATGYTLAVLNRAIQRLQMYHSVFTVEDQKKHVNFDMLRKVTPDFQYRIQLHNQLTLPIVKNIVTHYPFSSSSSSSQSVSCIPVR